MGSSQANKAATHQQIVEVAAKRFRERGLAGIGVADIMKEAGVTVGGFYKHFESKDQLVCEALLAAFSDYNLVGQGPDLLKEIREYLSLEHRDASGSGCATGALLGDMVHASASVRKVYTSQIKKSLAAIAISLSRDNAPSKRTDALLLMCSLLGAINVARAVDEPALSREILMRVGDRVAGLVSQAVPDRTKSRQPKKPGTRKRRLKAL